jgi:hypothetical protein
MGRIRTIKPEFHSHEELSALPAETHLLAAALTNYADDEGYFNANPVLVKAGTNPLRDDRTTVEEQLEQLAKIGYLEVRKSGNKHYGKICNFAEHQKVSHPSPSKLKSKFESLPKSSGEAPEKFQSDSALKGIEGNREQGTGKGMEASTALAVPAACGRLVCTLPLNSGDHEVFEADVQEWIPLYPAVDIRQELRTMKGWLLGSPQRRKTKTGIGRFINSWFARAQNGARGTSNGTFKGKTESSLDAAQQAIAIIRARGEAERDRIAAGEVGSEETGEAGAGGLSGVRGGSDGFRDDGYSIGPGVTVISPP